MIREYENTLRNIISLVVGTSDEAGYGVTEDRLENWKEKRLIEDKKYKGQLNEQRIIYYSDFYDLKTIISKNWDKFKEIFHDKKKFDIYFEQIQTYRNTIAHGRSLLPFQTSMLSGIVGDLKATLVQYHNRNLNADDYFIRIVKISDSLGNTWDNTMTKLGLLTDSTIRVGDSIEIIVEAYDPLGREIKYRICRDNFILNSDDGMFKFIVTKDMVGKIFGFEIFAFTQEGDYRNEDMKTCHYTVIP